MEKEGERLNVKRPKSYSEAAERLRNICTNWRSDGTLAKILSARDNVLGRYQPIFSHEHIPEMTETEFRSFLSFENNQHWTGLHRHAPQLTADMDRLRETLLTLLDPDLPLIERFDGSLGRVKGFGKALATAILTIVYPQDYGVWNNTSEAALKVLGLWPHFERGSSMGQRYELLNQVLVELAQDLEVDLWTLDSLLWEMANEPIEPGGPEEEQRFSLERHLQDFLRDNWERTSLGKEWALYSEPGDDEAGYEYPTEVGRIDLLAHHRKQPEWLIIELKRDQSTDETVGQVLRYMGWVQRHLAEPGEVVRGLIISRDVDDTLLYALRAVGNDRISAQRYEVEFCLKAVESGGDESSSD